ncbi:hypothetical protein [Streptomyces sp. NPDC020965]|uniref:hypothetical protein n=1 Tax=Streptomyces sp. NPDC020965 TaxID=3365105 RepID=UPI0037A34AF8
MKDELSGSYPIVLRTTLEPVTKRRWLGAGARPGSELPRLDGHQVAVYRVGENWIEDHGDIDPRGETARRAGSVAVVDRRRDVRVDAMVTIPSADATDFAVRARFQCTVTDAVALVREGPREASAALEGYLHGCPGLAEEGLDYATSEITEVRKRVSALLTASATVMPPRFAGLQADLIGVEVLTPGELLEYRKHLEELRRERERTEIEQAVAQDRLVREEKHKQELATLQEEYQLRLREQEQEFEIAREKQRSMFEREEAEKDAATPVPTSRSMLTRAFMRKELTAEQLADRLQAAEQEARRAAEREDELQRALLEKMAATDQEEERRRAERDDRRWELTRLEANRMLETQREDRLQKDNEKRDERLRRENEQRTFADQKLQMQFELFKRLIQEGHTSSTPIDMGEMLEQVLGQKLSRAPESATAGPQAEASALAARAPAAPGITDATDVTDVDVEVAVEIEADAHDLGEAVREEDGYEDR